MEPLTETEVLELSNLSKRKRRNIKQSLRYNFLTNKNTKYDRFVQSQSQSQTQTQTQTPQTQQEPQQQASSSSSYFEKPRKTGSSRNFTAADKLVVEDAKENKKVNFF